ncbi:MAG: alpha/beta hydrolase [Pseudomonadota bacterium]
MLAAALLSAAAIVTGCAPDEPVPEAVATEAGAAAAVADDPHPPGGAVASADGVIISFDERGDGERSVVFVHGWNCDRDYWQLQRDYLARSHRVISVDLAGHGRSGANRDQWSIRAFAEDVAAVVRELKLNEVTLVGHSLGGPVVLETALLLPDRVRHVVGVDTLKTPDERFPDEQVEAFRQSLETDYAATVTALVRTMFVDESHARVRDFVIRDMAASDPDVGIASLLALSQYSPMPALRDLDVPLTLINSSYEPTKFDVLNDRVGEFRLIEMDGVGHFPMLEDPTTFTNHLLEVLR